MNTNLATTDSPFKAITAGYISEERISLGNSSTNFLRISIECQHSWPYGIFHNAKYLILALREGKVECVSKSYKLPTFRKTKAPDTETVVKVINRYLAKLD